MTSARVLATILAWWEANRRDLPWRATRDPYAVWVAEVMCAQTQVERAAVAWTRWIARWPGLEALATATLAEVLGQWQGLGYPRRARDLHRAARIVAAEGWPEDLTVLPGVGAYTAAAIRCFAHEEAILPRDVNVSRVLARRFAGGVDTGHDPWRAAQALMEFGQRVCAAQPRCSDCPVREGCAGPAPTPPRRAPSRRFAGSLRQRRGTLLQHVLVAGPLPLDAVDREAAASLAGDGLVELHGAMVRPPGAGHSTPWNATSSVTRSNRAATTR